MIFSFSNQVQQQPHWLLLIKRPALSINQTELLPAGVSLESALSSLSVSRYSARLVNMR